MERDKNRFLIVTALVVVLIAFSIGFFPGKSTGCSRLENVTVRGGSLSPVLDSEQRAKHLRGYYSCNDVEIGHIVVYDWAGQETPIAKIVKAKPGDRLGIKGCHLYRNGEALETPMDKKYCFNGERKELLSLYTDQTIDGYLLLGTDPNGTVDSSRFGLVTRERISGRIKIGSRH